MIILQETCRRLKGERETYERELSEKIGDKVVIIPFDFTIVEISKGNNGSLFSDTEGHIKMETAREINIVNSKCGISAKTMKDRMNKWLKRGL